MVLSVRSQLGGHRGSTPGGHRGSAPLSAGPSLPSSEPWTRAAPSLTKGRQVHKGVKINYNRLELTTRYKYWLISCTNVALQQDAHNRESRESEVFGNCLHFPLNFSMILKLL